MSQLPRLISLVPKRFEDGGWTGVARFDWELRKIFPSLISLNTGWLHRWKLWRISRDYPDAIVITGNETSLLVPDRLRTIVVHHGCAQTHWNRDPHWRRRGPRKCCKAQRKMYSRPNRWYVALAKWTAEEFSRHYNVPSAPVIPPWVPPLPRTGRQNGKRPTILGDWRTYNKGESLVETFVEHFPDLEFRQLSCTYDTRDRAYVDADAYLSLSLSEGYGFSMADAEAAELPLVTTNVGAFAEFEPSEVIDWQERDQPDVVGAALRRALTGRRTPSFFDTWTRQRCANAWHEVIKEVASSGPREPVHA